MHEKNFVFKNIHRGLWTGFKPELQHCDTATTNQIREEINYKWLHSVRINLLGTAHKIEFILWAKKSTILELPTF